MKNLSVETKLGLFVVVAFVTLFYLTFSIGGKKMFKIGGQRTLVVYFNAITGVSEKSDVRMAGVKIGEVRKIELENYRAKVTIDLFDDYKIPEDSIAAVQGKGMLGEKFLDIRAGTSQKLIPNGGSLSKSISPANLDDIIAKLSDGLDNIKGVAASLQDVFASEEGKMGLKNIIKNISELSGSLNDVMSKNKEKLASIITNIDRASDLLQKMLAENRENLKGTVGNFNTFSKTFADKSPQLMDNLDKAAAGIKEMVAENRANLKDSMANIKEASGNFNGVLTDNRENFKITMANLKKSSEKLEEIMANVKQISAKLEKGEGTLGKLIQDDEVYNGVTETLDGAKNLTKQTGALKIGVGARGEYIGSNQNYQQSSRSVFSLKITPREDKYYMFEVGNDIRKQSFNNATGSGASAVSITKNSAASLLYTFYIAKRFGNVTLKGGLIETSGGLGADLHTMNDKLMLSVDAFNLGGYDQFATQPQVRVVGKYYPQKYLYFYVGGDELLNQYYRTFIAGVGLLADEDDMKFFLGRLL